MSHNVETMAYAGEMPWHGLGVSVSDMLTPREMQIAAGLDWEAIKVPTYIRNPNWKVGVGKEIAREIPTGEFCIARNTDLAILSPSVGKNWHEVSNAEVFNTFNDIVSAGNAKMETAGSLQDGKIIWALARLEDSFDILDGDISHAYMFLSASHKFGMSTRCDFTNIRVVCNNTLNAALSDKSSGALVIQHRTKFDAAAVADFMGASHVQMMLRKAQAVALSAKKAEEEDLKLFYSKVFPLTSKSNVREKELSRNAEFALALNNDDNQPGIDFARGSWWQAFNTVTFMADHHLANNADTRMFNSWLGTGRSLKLNALNLALEMSGSDADLAEKIAA
jgi:phage/plasmid-like protein (TIGR03299 family)